MTSEKTSIIDADAFRLRHRTRPAVEVRVGKEAELLEILANRIVVGRADDCDIVCAPRDVSSLHLELIVTADDLIVNDLDSRNGTKVNGKFITEPTKLKTGDKILLGSIAEIIISDVGEAPCM